MSWYRTGTVAVTNGSKTVTGVGTLWTTAVNAGDAFALVDANLNPTGAWYEVEAVTNNTTLVLKQSYAGITGSNKQYCVFNLVGNMTTPSFAQRLATFFASFQSLIDKPTTTPTALGIPVADANGDIDSGWLKDASTTVKGVVKVGSNISVADGVISVPEATEAVKGVVELATPAEVLAGVDTERAVTPATLTAKILGTVSQVGGVPTGAIIERGSNANGQYVKFADGTMICTKSQQVTIDIGGWSATGSIFTERNPVAYAFPAVFYTAPNVSVIARYISTSSGGSRAWVSLVSTTATNVVPILHASVAGSVTYEFLFLVIGRWY
jgi:hypothetical protein